MPFYFNASCAIFGDSVINSLDRFVGDTYFTKQAFANSLQKWQDVPLVLAQAHPDPFLFAQDRKAALANVNGRIVGRGSNPRIMGDKLVLSLKICDQEALDLQARGLLSLSSAFLGERDAYKRLTKIESANHILLFKRDDKNQPRDKTVHINNEVNYMSNNIKQYEPDASGYASEAALLAAQPSLLYKQADGIENKNDDGYEYDSIKKKWVTNNDQLFDRLLQYIKPEAYDTAEKYALLRAMFETDPAGLMVSLLKRGMLLGIEEVDGYSYDAIRKLWV